MSQIRPIFLIAGNTITGVLRGVVLNVLLVLGALLLLLAMSSGAVSQMEMRRTLIDSGLAVITILGAVITILTGFMMIPGEIENRTLYPVLSKPVHRWQFVIGKYMGAVGISGITVSLLSVLFFLAYFWKIHRFDIRLVYAVLMIFAMLMVLSALIIFFSTFMSWIGTIIASMVIWFMSSYSQFLFDMSQGDESSAFQKSMMAIVQKLLPNFQAMDLRYDIVQLETLQFTAKRILLPIGDASIYAVIALLLAVLIFKYREL